MNKKMHKFLGCLGLSIILMPVIFIILFIYSLNTDYPHYSSPDDPPMVNYVQKDNFKIPGIKHSPKVKTQYQGAVCEFLNVWHESWICTFVKQPPKSFYRKLDKLCRDSTSDWNVHKDSTGTTYSYCHQEDNSSIIYQIKIKKGERQFKVQVGN